LKRYADYLVSRGYAATGVRESVRVIEHFSHWLGRRSLSRKTVQEFLRRHLPLCRCETPVIRQLYRNRLALHRLLAISQPRVEKRRSLPPGFVGDLLRRYQEHLISVRGLAAGTVRNRLRSAGTMLKRLRVRRASQLAAWTPQRIEEYVAGEARRHEPSTAHSVATATRSLLRFLLHKGLISHDLATAVPRFAYWRLAPLPETLREEELAQLLNTPAADTPIGLRDRAILLCLSELGLRAAEVAGLELDRVDLVSGLLQVRRSKRGGLTTLPIPRRLSKALKDYLRHGRPTSTSRTVFVAHWPPDIGKPIRPVTISVLVKRWAARAGLRKDFGAAHVLRHSLASRMLGAGASLRQIADVLGHRSIDTTTIYAKVDLNALSQVGLPWPDAKEVQL
jgi:site-specific recombinase XerD